MLGGGKPNKSSYSAVLVIESAHFQNFKSLRDVRLTGLQRLTVLVGPSGVGKTSVLQGLGLLTLVKQALSRRGHEAGDRYVRRWVTRGEEGLRVELRNGEQSLIVTNTQELGVEIKQAERRLTLTWNNIKGSAAEVSEGDQALASGEHGLYEQALRALLLELDQGRLGAPSQASRAPQVAPDGAGLATLLAYLAGADREAVEAIESELREILMFTGRIRTLPDELEIEERENIRIDEQLIPRVTRRKVAAHRFEVEVEELGFVPGDLLSEGTLVTLGLLAVLHQPNCPSLILLDDIDQGLHPDAQAKLLAALRELLAKREDLQIICTTHSPYLLDHVAPEEVQVMSFDKGQVVAARLDRHEDWPNWKGKLQTGEFWQSAGESWVKASASDGE